MKIILLLCLIISSAFSLSLDERRSKIIEIIDEELAEVSRLAKQTRYKNPDHMLRMAELNLEKGRLWKEKENQEFLAKSDAQRRKINKKSFFKKSQRYFDQAYKNCLAITKRYKRYSRMSEVYYILGFYAKESGKNKSAARYLGLASKKSSKKSFINQKSTLSLAELYFNQSKFKRAIPLYEKALRGKRDKWWTKDSFNLAWCYYRVGKSSRAISKMKEIYSLSKQSKYIDMRELIERDIGVMFATSGKIDDGISFFKRIGVNFSGQLLGIAQSLKKQGKYSQAQKVLAHALKYEKNTSAKEEIYIEQLDLFARYNRYSSHMSVARKLFNLSKQDKLSSDGEKKLLFHVQKQGAILQKQVIGKTYKRLKKIRKSKANMAIEYFAMSAALDKKKKDEYLFLQAETAKVSSLDLTALRKYEETFNTGRGRFYKKSMDGMLYMLGSKRIKASTKNAWYAKVYESFLKNFKTDKRFKTIQLKLFRVYFDQRNYKKAKIVLDNFAKRYPRDYKNQEAMIANLMERERKTKNYVAIRKWVQEIDAKKYTVSAKYKTKLQELLTSIQIDEVQNKLKKGNKKEALVGYHKVLKDPHATKKARINAKYNIAALYYELGDIKKSFHWSKQAISEMKAKEVKHFSSSFLTISNFYFMKQDFKSSIGLLSLLLYKTCFIKTRVKNTAFKNAAFMALAEHNLTKVSQLLAEAKKCKVYGAYITEVEFELLKFYREKKMWRSFESLITKIAKNKKNRGKLVSYLEILETENEKLGNSSAAKEYKRRKWNYYSLAKKKKYTLKVEDLDAIAKDENEALAKIAQSVTGIRLRFPEKSFNSLLKRKLKKLDSLTAKAIAIQKIGSATGIVRSYNILISAYKDTVDSIVNFTPPNKSKEYVQSFKKSMKGLSRSVEQTMNSYIKNQKQSIYKNNILSRDSLVALQRGTNFVSEFFSSKEGILMDRGGK